MLLNPVIVKKLESYFAGKDEVVLAYLFGSQAKGTANSHRSDVDIAVYFKPKTGVFEYEESEWSDLNYKYDSESEIQDDLVRITNKEVDLIVLNRAPAYMVASILEEGLMLKEADRNLYLELWLRSSNDAEDYFGFFREYREIMERSHSFSNQDRLRLDKVITFLHEELRLNQEYGAIDQITYIHDDRKRKVLERNIENIANAGLDIAKILLASRHHVAPDTYVGVMYALVKLDGFDSETAKELAQAAKLRNFITHEYLDYRYQSIKKFVDGAQHNFTYLIKFTEGLLKAV